MIKTISMLFCASILFMTSACAQKPSAEQETGGQTDITTILYTRDSTEEEAETEASAESEEPLATEPEEAESSDEELPEQLEEDKTMNQTQFYITANGITFTADFADNYSAEALHDLLREGDLTINMSDYGGFEKVGSIGSSLPRKDTQISTTAGDIMLYQGDQIVIFYGSNSWSYSRLGRIDGADANDLLSAFGSGGTDITFSLTNPQ